jgi:hypothetical protein
MYAGSSKLTKPFPAIGLKAAKEKIINDIIIK